MNLTKAGALEYRRLDPVSDLDQLIFGSQDPFALEEKEEERIRVASVAAAVADHAARDDRYAALLRRRGVQAENLRDSADLDQVPQIPTSAFKRRPSPFPPPTGARESRSSGTQGTLSVVWRDRTTIERLLGSVRAGIRLIDDWTEDEAQILNLGPDRDEAGSLWFAYVMSLLELVYPTTHCVRGGAFNTAWTLDRLQAALEESAHVGIVGPPFLMVELAEAAEVEHVRLDGERLTVVTAGGWKRASGQSLDRQPFEELLASGLGIENRHQMRDAFNQVELNSVLFECRAGRKHVPPWVHVTVREPVRLEPCPPGTPGLLSYLDASAQSFPCFILADDIGVLNEGSCECERAGRTIEVLRRVRRDESWGCALKMDDEVGR